MSNTPTRAWHTWFKPLFKNTTKYERITVFLLGLAVLQPLQVTISGAAFAVKRFGLGPENIGVLLGITYCFQELLCLVGSITTTLLSYSLSNHKDYGKYWKYIFGTYSMVLSVLIAMLNTRLLGVFATGIGDSNLTMYYWTLSWTGFLFGAIDGTIRSISGPNGTFFGLGIALGGFCVNIVHFLVARFISEGSEIGYWTLYFQICWVIFISTVSGLMWTVVIIFDRFGPDKPSYSTGGGSVPSTTEALQAGAPFLVMIWGSLGTMFSIYPGMTPFSVVTFDKAQQVLRTNLYLNAVVGIVAVLGKLYTKFFTDWNQDTTHMMKYGLLLLFVPYVTIAVCVIRTLHYPTGTIGSMIYMRPKVVFVISAIFFCCGSVLNQCGFGSIWPTMSGAGKSGSTEDGRATVMTIAGTGVMMFLVTTKFISEGYLRSFRAAKAGLESGLPWPTEGMTDGQAFRYWAGNGFKGAAKICVDIFTFDLRTKLLR